LGISDVIPVPVAIDEEIEKWTIFGQPVAEVWFTTTEKIHQIIQMGPIKNIFNWGRKNSVYFLMQPMGCCGVEMFVFGAAPYDRCDDHLRLLDPQVPACIQESLGADA
jgi:F420H2 dehydrogenase subunit B